MANKQDLYWMEYTLDEKIEQKVCEYLREHHAEYRKAKQKMKELVEQNRTENRPLSRHEVFVANPISSCYDFFTGIHQLLHPVFRLRTRHLFSIPFRKTFQHFQFHF